MATSYSRRPGRLRRSWAFLRRLLAESVEDRLFGLAAETAFFVVLGLFPGLLIAAGLLGVLDVFVGSDVAAQARQQVVAALDAVLTDKASAAVASVENLFAQRRGNLLTFATLGALVTLSGAFAVVINALNITYDVGEGRSWIRRRLLGLALGVGTLIVVVIALAAVVVGPLLGGGAALADLVGLGAVLAFAWNVLRLPVLFVGVVLWVSAMFRLAPNRRVRWRATLPGALLTAVLWVIASLGFHLYLVLIAGANPLLGAFGGAVVVMMWVYLLSLALLLGAELNATMTAPELSGPVMSTPVE